MEFTVTVRLTDQEVANLALFDWLIPATRGWVTQQLDQQEQRMNAEIKAVKDKFDADVTAIKANLANVAGDIANLNTKIQELNDKLAAGMPLTQEDKDALAAVAAGSADLVTATKALADTVPDPAPPVEG